MSALEAARKGRKESVQSEAGAQTTEERIRSLGLTCGTLQSSLWVEETDVPAPCRWLWKDEELADRDGAVRQNFVGVWAVQGRGWAALEACSLQEKRTSRSREEKCLPKVTHLGSWGTGTRHSCRQPRKVGRGCSFLASVCASGREVERLLSPLMPSPRWWKETGLNPKLFLDCQASGTHLMSLFNIYFPNRLEQFWRDIILRFVEISLNTYLSGKPA